jgi:chemotaxis protein CheC
MSVNFSMGLIQQSAVHEIANIGLGHAMTALSTMTGHSFNMSIPNVDSVPATTLVEYLGGEEVGCVGVMMPYEGDVSGQMAFLFPFESAQKLWTMLLGQAPEGFEDVDEISTSAMMEVGNIINSNFLNAISEMTGLKMHATPPAFGMDYAYTLASTIVAEAEQNESVALAVETQIFNESSETKGFFLLIPTVDTLNKLFERLGIAEAA